MTDIAVNIKDVAGNPLSGSISLSGGSMDIPVRFPITSGTTTIKSVSPGWAMLSLNSAGRTYRWEFEVPDQPSVNLSELIK